MKKFLFFIFLSSSILFASELLKVRTYTMQKDEIKTILVKYGGVQKVFRFRWTLYKNEGLVLFSEYDDIVSQHMLYLNFHHQSFRIMLKPKGAYEFNVPYMLVKFVKFDFTKHKAIFEIWLYDKRQEVYLKYL